MKKMDIISGEWFGKGRFGELFEAALILLCNAARTVEKTVSGLLPLSLTDAVLGNIISLKRYGSCTQSGTPTIDSPVDIACNNGVLKMVDDELPEGYKRIEYIQFDGDFHYVTNEKLYGSDEITITLSGTSTTGQNIFGCYSGTSSGTKNYSLYIYGAGSNNNSYLRYGETLYRPKYGGGERTLVYGPNGMSGFATDVSMTPEEFETGSVAWIGMLPNSTSPHYTGKIRGSILIGNRLKYIPCERVSDGVIGYYEPNTEVFLEPVGEGTPEKGPYDGSHYQLEVVGTQEVVSVNGTQTASVADLFSVENYADTQDIISGAVTRKVGIRVLDGTESWLDAATSSVLRYRTSISDAVGGSGRSAVLSTNFSYASSGQPTSGIFLSSKSLYLIPDQTITTVDDFKAFLAGQYSVGTPVIVIYPLGTEATEAVTAQVLTTADGDNTVSSNVSPAEAEVTYVGEVSA